MDVPVKMNLVSGKSRVRTHSKSTPLKIELAFVLDTERPPKES